MADATKELSIIISARDEASKTIGNIGSAFGDLVNASKTGSFVFAGALTLVSKSIIDAASDMQQAKVAFTVFEGSAAAASKTLKELSDFAKVTPFTFPTITEAAKRLMAYGVAANDLIPTLKNLGDISAGVGTDKLPQLILAFGQVKAKTTLAGTELRQFTETGIPIIEALVNVINKTGGAMTQTAVKTKGTAQEIGNLNDKLNIAKQKLTEVTANHKAHTSTIMAAKDAVQNYEQKLAKATTTTGGLSAKTKVTAADIADMASKGEISFGMVQKALQSMTEKGGKFFNLMEMQSQTFSGRMSNISDQLVRVALNIAGISTNANNFGDVIKGGAFDILSNGAQRALDILNALEPQVKGIIAAFVQNQAAIGAFIGILVGGLLGAAIAIASIFAPLLLLMALFGSLGAIIGFVIANFNTLLPILSGIAAALLTVAAIVLVPLIPAFIAWGIAAAAAALATILALLPVILVVTAVGIVVADFVLAWQKNFANIQGITKSFVDWLKSNFQSIVLGVLDIVSGGWVSKFIVMRNAVEGVISAIRGLISAAQDLASRAGKGLKIPGFQHGGFVPGSYGQAVPAILHGGERVIPRTGVDVNNGGGGGGVNINISGSFQLDSQSRINELADTIIRKLGRDNELAGKGLSI